MILIYLITSEDPCASYVKTKLALPRIFDYYLIGQILKWGVVLRGHLVDKQGILA